MLPLPSVGARACALLAEHGCDSVLFGAAAPLGLLAPRLRKAGAKRIVGLTHGHEAGWAALPGARITAAAHRRRGRRPDLPGRVFPDPDGAERCRPMPLAAW